MGAGSGPCEGPPGARWLICGRFCSMTSPLLLPSQDVGAEGSPLPLGRLLPKVQEVARCLGELLAAACAGRVSGPCVTRRLCPAWCHPSPLPWRLCPGMPGPLDLPDHALPQAPPSLSSGPPCPDPTSPSAPGWQQQTVLMLKEQNRLLTQVSAGRAEGGGRRPAGP